MLARKQMPRRTSSALCHDMDNVIYPQSQQSADPVAMASAVHSEPWVLPRESLLGVDQVTDEDVRNDIDADAAEQHRQHVQRHG